MIPDWIRCEMRTGLAQSLGQHSRISRRLPNFSDRYTAQVDVDSHTVAARCIVISQRSFPSAVASSINDAVLEYPSDWNEILWQVYPDYAPTGAGNLFGSAVNDNFAERRAA